MSLHPINFPRGQSIVKKMLTSQWLRKLDLWLSGSNSDLCLAAMKLTNAMSSFGGKGEQKSILEAFTWDIKVSL